MGLDNMLLSKKDWDISMDVTDTRLFRGEPNTTRGNINVIVGFTGEDIADIEGSCKIKKNSRSIAVIKERIIDWCARAAGALNESEFYCIGINIDVDENGQILKGETIFRRRYEL